MSIGGFSPVMPSSANDVKTHERKVESDQKASEAQGLSGDDKESAATSEDRDADGRQAWRWTERPAKKADDEKENKTPDLTGQTGSNLDLSG